MKEGVRLSSWHYKAVIISVFFSMLGYLAFSFWGGRAEVGEAVVKVGVWGVTIALLMSSLNYGLRFLRWQGYLDAFGHSVPWKPSLQIYLAGFALTTTPGKAGEALRGILLKRWGVPYTQSFAAFVSERLCDLLAVVLLTLLGLTIYPDARPIILVGAILVVAGFFILSQRKWVEYLADLLPAQGGKVIGLLRQFFNVLLETQKCHRPVRLLGATLLSITAWSAEALAFYWVLNWMGLDITLFFAVFVYALALLAGALSFMPGGLGGAEAVMVAFLVWKGVPNGDAVAATLIIRLTTLWFAVGVGVCALTNSYSFSDESRP
ncbi:UPF0104 family protein [Pseudomonas sp. MWU12-2534b]|nr:UPF0104 family protein [Pseudomonas sp. MWU12-2534b]